MLSRRSRMKTRFIVGQLFAAALLVSTVTARQNAPAEWPQWRGPERDGISREVGLAQSWPPGGPPVVWSAPGLGNGYGGVAVKDGRVFVQGMRGNRSFVHSLNLADGQYVWSKNIGPATSNDRGPGPRGTPTIDGDRLYVL